MITHTEMPMAIRNTFTGKKPGWMNRPLCAAFLKIMGVTLLLASLSGCLMFLLADIEDLAARTRQAASHARANAQCATRTQLDSAAEAYLQTPGEAQVRFEAAVQAAREAGANENAAQAAAYAALAGGAANRAERAEDNASSSQQLAEAADRNARFYDKSIEDLPTAIEQLQIVLPDAEAAVGLVSRHESRTEHVRYVPQQFPLFGLGLPALLAAEVSLNALVAEALSLMQGLIERAEAVADLAGGASRRSYIQAQEAYQQLQNAEDREEVIELMRRIVSTVQNTLMNGQLRLEELRNAQTGYQGRVAGHAQAMRQEEARAQEAAQDAERAAAAAQAACAGEAYGFEQYFPLGDSPTFNQDFFGIQDLGGSGGGSSGGGGGGCATPPDCG